MSATAETNVPTLSREVRLARTVVFVDGITRSGKSMMGPILASFDRVEIERLEFITEYLGALYSMGKIDRDAAVALVQSETDYQLYNSVIGRNTNFRFGDHSSVWRNPKRLRYFMRLFAKDGSVAVRQIEEERPIFQNLTHDQLANFGILHEAFGADLRLVEMVRHPVDLADSWLRRGWGTRFGTEPLAHTFCIRHQGQDLPYYAIGWEETYLSASPTGRVIRIIQSLWDRNQTTFASLNSEEKRLIFYVPFESFIQRPWPYLEPLAEFIGTRTTRHTPSALKRQKCPRKYEENTGQKRLMLEQQVSPEEKDIVQRLVEEYETLVENDAI
jgi:hypothetical protein